MNYGLNIFNDNKYSQRLAMDDNKKSSIKIKDNSQSQRRNREKNQTSNLNESMNLNNYPDEKNNKSYINTNYDQSQILKDKENSSLTANVSSSGGKKQ